MTMGAGLAIDMVLRSKMVSRPQVVAAVVWPVQGCEGTPPLNGVPAKYRVAPSIKASVAAGTGTGLQTPSGRHWFGVVSKVCTLAWAPPHSGPQFRTYATLSSLLKNAVTGWSKE